jgi:tetratricopeptide (TPR) repeat protein
MRATNDPAQKKKLEDEAIHELQSALGIDNDSYYAYTLLGLIYLEGSEKNRNRLDVAKFLFDQAMLRNPNFAPLRNAQGLMKMRRGDLGHALEDFKAAAGLDPKFYEAHMNWGLVVLAARDYTEAENQFRSALKTQPKSYSAMIGLGVALRGAATILRSKNQLDEFPKKIDEAEKTYNDAMGLDKGKGDAYFNLGLLYMDYRTDEKDPHKKIDAYKKSKQYFQDFISRADKADPKVAEAQGNMTQCDKYIDAITKSLNAPPPTTPPAGQAAQNPK